MTAEGKQIFEKHIGFWERVAVDDDVLRAADFHRSALPYRFQASRRGGFVPGRSHDCRLVLKRCAAPMVLANDPRTEIKSSTGRIHQVDRGGIS